MVLPVEEIDELKMTITEYIRNVNRAIQFGVSTRGVHVIIQLPPARFDARVSATNKVLTF
jgi:hypothetical protein